MGELAYRGRRRLRGPGVGQPRGSEVLYTGEPLDGSRIYYNAMRPVADAEQLDAELARADALGYQILKTYVRLMPSS